MDIYDPGLMAASGRVDGTSTPTSVDKPKTELDEGVEKLVGNISSWWSGIAKKSQDSIQQARKEMENRGGMVNYAKSEYAKLESSLDDAQKKARDQSQQPPAAENAPQDATTEVGDADQRSETSKGKQRALDDQDSPATAEAGTTSDPGPTLGATVSSLFSKLTSDPRIVQLQNSLTTTLQSVGPTKEGDGSKKPGAANPIKLQESLSKLSLAIHSHLPHLDVEKSQQLAKRYLNATESFAKEIQSDMKDFVGELVRIVPPEGETEAADEASGQAVAGEGKNVENEKDVAMVSDEKSPKAEGASKMAPSTAADTRVTAKAAPPSEEEDEDFAWDEDDEEAAAATAVKPAAASKDERPEAAKASTAEATVKKPSQDKNADSEDDSDWE